ncbi:hypothetical protein ACFWYW_46755 [Nonomuraea sp. NPDC059023]|uniref:hypothetical protein n=1 Tax=unclassified Nonomuraea TaxID=2593643 RepID=UPI0036BB21A1
MGAAHYDLLIEQGTHYERLLRLTSRESGAALDLTGCVLRAQVRVRHSAPDVLYELTQANGRLVITDAAAGLAQLTIPAADSAAWPWRAGVYDVELVDAGGRPVRLMKGAVIVSPEVTR